MEEQQKLDMSVVMIVRDEEELLDRCLASINKTCREIIVVDTGSVDQTKMIAAKYNAKIFDLEWKHDFAEARNYALSKAGSEWILILDADEYIDEANCIVMRDAIGATDEAQVFIVNVDNKKKDELSSKGIRIWKNGLGIKYENKIHEQVTFPPDVDLSKFVYSDIHIIHTGYDDFVKESKDKKERNYRLLADAVMNDPNDEYLVYQLGKHLVSDNRSEEAFRLIHELLAKNGSLNFAPTYQVFIKILWLRKSFDYARKVAEFGIKKYPEYLDLKFLLGNILLETGYLDEAIKQYQYCIERKDERQEHLFPKWRGVTDFLSFKGMALAYLMKNNEERALELLLQSIQYDPEPTDSIKLLAAIASKHFPPDKVRGEFSALLQSIDIDPSPYIGSFDQ